LQLAESKDYLNFNVNNSNQVTSGLLAGFAYILATVLLSVYGQIVLKWQVAKAGVLPVTFLERVAVLIGLIWNPWILSSIAAGCLAFLCWMAAMTKFELSYAYPFMSLSFVLVLVLSALLFHEPVTLPKVAGLGLVIVGLIIASRG
jgi:drug/metabolite transporter (DMT)-like permease